MIDNPRIRVLVGTHGLRLAVALAVVAVLALGMAGWLAYAPAEETVTQQAHHQQIVTETETSAVVTAEESLWPAGTELRDKPVYLFNATPSMTVVAETDARGAGEATITHEWVLTVRAENEDEVFWSETETLASQTHEGTTARTTAEVDAVELRERIDRRQGQIGDAGTVTAVLTLTVEYETDRYEGSKTLSTPIEMRGDAYGLGEDLSDSTAHSTPVRTTVTRPPNSALVYGLAGVGLVALAAAAGIVRGRPESIDVEEARNELHRQRYAEWISPGILPDDLDGALLEVESLEDVVDVAIDTNERVIHDDRRNVYAVISEGVVYYFSPEGTWEEASFPRFDAPGVDGGSADDGPVDGSPPAGGPEAGSD